MYLHLCTPVFFAPCLIQLYLCNDKQRMRCIYHSDAYRPDTPGSGHNTNYKEMNISELIKSGANVAITITPRDLNEFALNLIEQAKQIEPKVPDQYLTPTEVANKLNVTKSTLWRWDKIGYLTPNRVGRFPKYKLSDITKILEG